MTPSGYDLIGDLHGHLEPLAALLARLGYEERGPGFAHPSRQVVFVGDFVDRGPAQREVIGLCRAMVEAGQARAVMGNHEYNAIAFATGDGGGGHLRPHSERNRRQHAAFLDAFRGDPAGRRDALDWFRTLPLWLETDGFRVVHACWHRGSIERILAAQDGDSRLGDALLRASARRGSWQFEAIETLLKGMELDLPAGARYPDKEGTSRHQIRIRWWDGGARTFRAAYFGPPSLATHIPDDEIEGDHGLEYGHGEKPVFVGHYWLEGEPVPLAPNIACLDYSVAKPGGRLCAYRWDGEAVLAAGKFVTVPRS
jgi:hypothetical protein